MTAGVNLGATWVLHEACRRAALHAGVWGKAWLLHAAHEAPIEILQGCSKSRLRLAAKLLHGLGLRRARLIPASLPAASTTPPIVGNCPSPPCRQDEQYVVAA